MNRIALFLMLIAATALPGFGTTITYQGPVTTVNDGAFYVLPYQVTIDGVQQQVICFDLLDDVSRGDVWNSSVLGIANAAASGFFPGSNLLSEYERVAWLSTQSYSNAAQQIGLQHAIWNVFASTFETASSLAYEQAADTAAASGYSGFDFSSFRFIQQSGATAGAAGTEQAFVFQTSAVSSASSLTAPAPEPGTITMVGLGIALFGLSSLRRRKSAR